MVRWEWNVVKVASELGSHSSKHAWQQCFPECCWACEGWCVWTLFFLYCLGMVCRARTRWQNLGLQYVWVQTGVLGRKRLGSWAMLLGQSSRPKWIWVPWCRTRYIQEFKSASLACSQQLPLTEKKWTTPPPGVFKINVMLSTIASDRKEVDNATSGGFQDQRWWCNVWKWKEFKCGSGYKRCNWYNFNCLLQISSRKNSRW